jgi:hypothetical protein
LDRLVILFIMLVTMLFIGIGIMISPTKIATILPVQHTSTYLGAIMTFASVLFVSGLVGIAIIGFIISKDQTASKSADNVSGQI